LRPAFEQIGCLAHHHIGTVSFLPPPTEDQFPKPVPVRPPDLVQPDFLRHTLGPSAAKSLNSFDSTRLAVFEVTDGKARPHLDPLLQGNDGSSADILIMPTKWISGDASANFELKIAELPL
jgi:hypothetical protein